MFKNIKLKSKMVLAFLVVGLVPFSVVSITSVIKSSNALTQQAYGQLKGIREIKKIEINDFFQSCENDMAALLDTVRSLKQGALSKLESVQSNKKVAVELIMR